jgi:predicted O-methyltransferase YrrM
MKGIPGFFTEDEGRWYRRFAAGVTEGIFVEIGSWKGRSTSFIGALCNANRTRLVCVDHWGGSHDSLAARYSAELAEEDVAATFRANMQSLGITVEILREPSLAAAARFADGSLDRVFLDGSHDPASVAEDLAAWFPKLNERGRLGGHDYSPEKHPELCRVVDAFARERALVVKRGPRSVFELLPR